MPHKPGVVAQTYNSKTWEVDTGGPKVQAHLPLHTNLDTSMGFMRTCLKLEKRKEKEKKKGKRKE